MQRNLGVWTTVSPRKQAILKVRILTPVRTSDDYNNSKHLPTLVQEIPNKKPIRGIPRLLTPGKLSQQLVTITVNN